MCPGMPEERGCIAGSRRWLWPPAVLSCFLTGPQAPSPVCWRVLPAFPESSAKLRSLPKAGGLRGTQGSSTVPIHQGFQKLDSGLSNHNIAQICLKNGQPFLGDGEVSWYNLACRHGKGSKAIPTIRLSVLTFS